MFSSGGARSASWRGLRGVGCGASSSPHGRLGGLHGGAAEVEVIRYGPAEAGQSSLRDLPHPRYQVLLQAGAQPVEHGGRAQPRGHHQGGGRDEGGPQNEDDAANCSASVTATGPTAGAAQKRVNDEGGAVGPLGPLRWAIPQTRASPLPLPRGGRRGPWPPRLDNEGPHIHGLREFKACAARPYGSCDTARRSRVLVGHETDDAAAGGERTQGRTAAARTGARRSRLGSGPEKKGAPQWDNRPVVHSVDDSTNVVYEREVRAFLIYLQRGEVAFASVEGHSTAPGNYVSDLRYLKSDNRTNAPLTFGGFLRIFEPHRGELPAAHRALKSRERMRFGGEGRPTPTQEIAVIITRMLDKCHVLEAAALLLQLGGWLGEGEEAGLGDVQAKLRELRPQRRRGFEAGRLRHGAEDPNGCRPGGRAGAASLSGRRARVLARGREPDDRAFPFARTALRRVWARP